MSADPLLFEIDGPIARLTLNRPANGNAINLPMMQALLAAAIRCDSDPAIRCVVLTGAGRFFCAGGDLALFGASADDAPAMLSELAGTLHMAVSRLARMAKPLLVLVNGPAAGGGLSMAIAGDIVLAGRSAHFMTAYGAIGLTPDGGMTWMLPRLVGLRKAQELLLTNRRVQSSEAEAIGLVTKVVNDADLVAEGEAMAQLLVRSPVAALGAARALLLESFSNGLETQLAEEADRIRLAGGAAESREGIASFLERRAPNFGGIR